MSLSNQFSEYIAALRLPFQKICRLRFLNPDGSTAFAVDNNAHNRLNSAFITDGTLNCNLQNGQRRTATVTLALIDSRFEYNVNAVWFGSEIALDEGVLLADGTPYYIQQGVFLVNAPVTSHMPNQSTITYNLVDKWSNLDGSLFGNLSTTYVVESGTNIFSPIVALLSEDRGNGVPVDGVSPIFTNYYNGMTQILPDGSSAALTDAPYTLTTNRGGTIADVILGLTGMLNAWVGYDATGALRIDPSQDDILDSTKPVMWRFSMQDVNFCGATYTANNADVYNDYIVVGEQLDDNSQPAGRATNYDPRSTTNANIIGLKTIVMEAAGYSTNQQCIDRAVWELKRSSILQQSVSITCSQLFHIRENELVEIWRTDKPGEPMERHLVTGFSRPISHAGTMTINATSVNDFSEATITNWPE